jgi:SAM-dependent methyltransferase
MSDWISFFDSEHALYVNARHRQVHAALVAQGIATFIASPDAQLLDYGCGEALYGEQLAAHAGRLLLCEAAPHLREKLAARFAANAKVMVLAPQDIERLPDGSLDLIVMHSVAQYLAPTETDRLFVLFRRLLRPAGRLVLGDIVPPGVPAIADALALIRLAAQNRFLLAAIGGLLRTALSEYVWLRRAAGLTRYSEAEMLEKLRAAGFSAERAARNIGHNQRRMTFVATPR